jgi:glycosyltransferase involved in cell wall biosynthesis
MAEKIKIGFLSYKDPLNRKSWSGGYYSMYRALERNVGDVIWLGPIQPTLFLKLLTAISRLFQFVFHSRYEHTDNIILSLLYSYRIRNKIMKYKPDFIFAPAAVPELAFASIKIPVVYVSDATSIQFIEYYPSKIPISNLSLKEIAYLERKAFINSDYLCFSSSWAAQDCISRYRIPAGKVKVIPFGSNFPIHPNMEFIASKRKRDDIKLLFLGGDWHRKGGDIAYQTMVQLNEIGIHTSLTIIGCKPDEPHKYEHPYFTNIGFLNMGVPSELETLVNLFQEADFFILPTRAECAALAFCDANAFGLPVFTTNTGGISSFITEGVNGYMLPLTAGGKEFADKISGVYNDNQLFSELILSSRKEFDEKLNWNSWAIKVKGLLALK